jgi:DNA-binding MarR family transcriptional regulator
LLISPSGLTRRLDGLVRDGLVERHACPSDRRGSLAVLTPTGLTALERAAPTHVTGVRRYLIDRLEREQLLDLTAAFASIRDALDDAQRQAPLARRATR